MQLKVINFKSRQFTPFAPYWDYLLAESVIDFDPAPLVAEILEKEKDIIANTKFENDWGTRLGKNSLTSRSNTYNLLRWDSAAPLKTCIKKMHDSFMNDLNIPMSEAVWGQSWANVMRKKEKIFPHCHGFGPWTYLSGHVCLKVKETSTYYINPYGGDPWQSENFEGKITLFPGWLRHYTDQVPYDDEERVTVAFDLFPQEAYDEDIKDSRKHHWEKL